MVDVLRDGVGRLSNSVKLWLLQVVLMFPEWSHSASCRCTVNGSSTSAIRGANDSELYKSNVLPFVGFSAARTLPVLRYTKDMALRLRSMSETNTVL